MVFFAFSVIITIMDIFSGSNIRPYSLKKMCYSENTAWWLKEMEKKQDSVGRTLKARLYFWESKPLLPEAVPAFPPWPQFSGSEGSAGSAIPGYYTRWFPRSPLKLPFCRSNRKIILFKIFIPTLFAWNDPVTIDEGL